MQQNQKRVNLRGQQHQVYKEVSPTNAKAIKEIGTLQTY